MADFYNQNMKRDVINDFLFKAAEWIKNNRNTFFTIVGTVGGVLILAAFFLVKYHDVQLVAAEKIAVAQAQLYQGQVDQANAMLDEIVAKYSGSYVGAQAAIIKANFHMGQGGYENALNVLKTLVSWQKPAEYMPMAFSMMGTVEETMGRLDDAAKSYSALLDKYPDNFLAPKAYESLGRVYEMKRSVPEAISTYEKLANLYPNTAWSQKAQERLGYLAQVSAQMNAAQKQPAR